MADQGEALFHKILTVTYGDNKFDLKIQSTSTPEGIEKAIRNRFQIAADQPVILVDQDGCDVVIDAQLDTGRYTLELGSQNREEKKGEQLELKKAGDVEDFDENKATKMMDAQSRTLASLGVGLMKWLRAHSVLILGLQGVGVETAKNIILAGPANVVVWDPQTVTLPDLGTNFYLTAKDVGKSRAEACVAKLAELNSLVNVTAWHKELSKEFLAQFGTVIVTTFLPKAELLRINKICREKEPKANFILALTFGVVCNFFSDFGNHVVTDPNGEPNRSLIVQNIDSRGEVTVADDKHDLDDDDWVSFAEVQGASFLNDLDKVVVRRVYQKVPDIDPKSKKHLVDAKGQPRYRLKQVLNKFKIENVDEKKIALYTKGGVITPLKKPIPMENRSLAESLLNPNVDAVAAMMNAVFHLDNERGDKKVGSQLHFAFLALLDFHEKHNRLPHLHSGEDAKEMVQLAKNILIRHKEQPEGKALVVDAIDEDAVAKFSLFARTELPGFTAFLGGVAAQEMAKGFGKYLPIHQWFYGDYFELLPGGTTPPADAKASDSRYSYQVSIFGQAIQDKIFKQRWFLVGCGALGCEYLKGYALMGLGAKGGKVIVTDMDRVELSNLSRQFLFREEHVKTPKAVSSTKVAKQMNPDMNFECHEEMLWTGTEHKFNDEFWDSLDGVWNALDNIQARLYTDSKCLLHGKPLLESGTEGTKANHSVHIPGQTPHYGATPESPTEGIPQCTLKNFPFLILHCIEWSRPRFEDLFGLAPSQVNTFLGDKEQFFKQVLQSSKSEESQLKDLKAIKQLLDKSQNATFADCLNLAFEEFNVQFRNQIKDLINAFPENHREIVTNKETGEKIDLGAYWRGRKRFPRAVEYSVEDPMHSSFLHATTNLYAFMFGLPQIETPKEFLAKLREANLASPEWVPGKVVIEGDDPDKKDREEESKESKESKQEDLGEPVGTNPNGDAVYSRELFELIKKFQELDTKSYPKKLKDQDFEKDDDTNFHIDFVTAASNLRAWNYHINPTSRLQAKLTAGRIIPALASTTAMITGLTVLEFYKLVLGLKKVHADAEKKTPEINPYFNSNINLATGLAALNIFATTWPEGAESFTEELEDKETKSKMITHYVAYPKGFTAWDKIVIKQKGMTVHEFVEAFPKIHHGVRVNILAAASGSTGGMIYGHEKRPIKSWEQKVKNAKSENQRKQAEATLKKNIEFNAKIDAGYQRPLVDVYVELYGELPAGRKYVLLGGQFLPLDKDKHSDSEHPTYAKVPLIQYYFA
jgi:ubiquitin-activating enzyme E1